MHVRNYCVARSLAAQAAVAYDVLVASPPRTWGPVTSLSRLRRACACMLLRARPFVIRAYESRYRLCIYHSSMVVCLVCSGITATHVEMYSSARCACSSGTATLLVCAWRGPLAHHCYMCVQLLCSALHRRASSPCVWTGSLKATSNSHSFYVFTIFNLPLQVRSCSRLCARAWPPVCAQYVWCMSFVVRAPPA